jgi:formylglycine-generating enzyme required for sulfatase activity
MSESHPDKNLQGDKLKVFLCHASEDSETVRKLASRLREIGWLKVWRDKDELLPGQNWELEIPKEVKNSQVIIICLSNNISAKIIKGSYINKEFKLAWEAAANQPAGAISIIPLRLEECTVPEQFEKLQWADYFVEGGWDKLLRSLETRAREIGLLKTEADQMPNLVRPPTTVITDHLNLPKLRARFRSAGLKQAWEEIIALGEAILALTPNDSDIKEKMANAYFRWGQAYQKTGDYSEAMEKISMAIELDPATANYFWERALIDRESGNQKDALKDFLKAIELEPGQAELYFEAGKIYHQTKRLEKALEFYNNALMHDPAKGEYYYYRGLVNNFQAKVVQAEADFEQAVSLDYAEAKTELAQIQAAKAKNTPPPPKPSPRVSEPEKVVEKIAPSPPPPPVETEQERLINELLILNTTHERRRNIGEQLAKIGDTRRGVGVREDGLPDIVWLPVTSGGDITLEIDDKSQSFKVAPFFIAQYPVTFSQYEAFVKAQGGYNNPKWWQGLQKQELAEQYYKGVTKPRDQVSWYQSVAFCRWLTARLQGQSATIAGTNSPLTIGQNAEIRLPTEWEWQWAAQGGSEKREYPWGQWQEGYANTAEANLGQTVAVGMYPQGAAICGAMDMSGNVWEWCANKYSKKNDWRSVRGGSYGNYSGRAACAYRLNNVPNFSGSPWGFRVVVSSLISASDL